MDDDPFAQYEFEESDPVQEKVQGLINFLQTNKKKIIIGIVGLIIVFLLYTFFFTGFVNVTINVRDTEGSTISGNSVEVTTQDGTEVIFLGSGQGAYNFSTKSGIYSVKVIAGNYKAFDTMRTFNGTDYTEPVVLEKDVSLEIESVAFPEILYAGQEAEAQIEIRNTGPGIAKSDFVFENPKKIDLISQQAELTVPGNATRIFRVAIIIPETVEIKDLKVGDLVKDNVRLKFLNEDSDISYSVLPAPNLRYETAHSITLNAGEIKKENIKVTNSSKFPVEGLKMDVEIVSSQANDPEDIASWFSFTRGNEFSTLAPSKSQELTLQITIPIDAKKDTISGAIVYSAPFISKPEKKELTLQIRNEVDTGVSLTVPDLLTIRYSSSDGKFPIQNRDISIRNIGDLDLENVTLAVRNPAECTSEWFRFLKSERIVYTLLKAGERVDELAEISAPLSALDTLEPVVCRIGYFYFHPITKTSVEEVLLLKITPTD